MHNSILFHARQRLHYVRKWELVNLIAFQGYHQNSKWIGHPIKSLLYLDLPCATKKSQHVELFVPSERFIFNTTCECLKLSVGVRFVSPQSGELQSAAGFNNTDARPQWNNVFPASLQKFSQRKTQHHSTPIFSALSPRFSFLCPLSVAFKGSL